MAFRAADIEATLVLDRDPFTRGLLLARKDAEEFENNVIRTRVEVEQRMVGGEIKGSPRNQEVKVSPRIDEPAMRGVVARLNSMKKVVVDVTANTTSVTGAMMKVRMLFRGMIAGLAATAIGLVPAFAAVAGAVGSLGIAAGAVALPFVALAGAMGMFMKEGGQAVKAFKRETELLGESFKNALGPGATLVFRGLTQAMSTLRTALPPLTGDFKKLGSAVSLAVKNIAVQMASPEYVRWYQLMIQAATKAVAPLTRSLMSLMDIFKNVSTAAMPLLIEQLEKLSTWLGKVAKSTSDIDKLRASMRRMQVVTGQVWQIFKNLGSVLGAVFKAATGGSDGFLKSLTQSTGKIAEFLNSAKGQDLLKDLLKSLTGYMNAMVEALPSVLQLLGQVLKVATIMFKVFMGVYKAVSDIHPALGGVFAAAMLLLGPVKTVKLLFGTILKSVGSLITKTGIWKGMMAGMAGIGGRIPGFGGGGERKGSPRGGPMVGGAPGRGGGGAGIQKVTGMVSLTPQTIAAIGRSGGGERKGSPRAGAGAAAGGAAAGGAAAKTGGKAAGAGFIASMAAAIKGGVSKITSALKGVLSKLGPLFKRIPGLGAVATVIGGAFRKLKLGPILKKALGLLPKVITSFLPRLVGAFLGWPAMVGVLIYSLLPKKVKDAIKKGIKSIAKAIFDAGKFVVGNLAKGIGAAAKWVLDGIKKIGKGIWDTVKGWASSLFNGGKAIIGKLGDGIKAGAGKVIDAARWVARQVKNIMPGSEPKDPRSPLRGLGKAGEAIVDNIGAGVAKRTAALRAQVIKMAEAAFAPTRSWAAGQLKMMEIGERAAAGPELSRKQQEHNIQQRISNARYSRDDRGHLLNNPPPGVKRRDSAEEREMKEELATMRYEWEKEDLQKTVDVNISAMIPSDPKVLREMQRSISRAQRQGKRRRPSTTVLA